VSRFFNPVPDLLIDELLEKLPDFRKAYLCNGLEPEEYESFGPVCHFRNIFVDAWSKAAEVIEKAR
jgi:transaldolase